MGKRYSHTRTHEPSCETRPHLIVAHAGAGAGHDEFAGEEREGGVEEGHGRAWGRAVVVLTQ